MSFWSTQRFKSEHREHKLIEPFNDARIEQGAYELALSREVITTEDDENRKVQEREGTSLEIRPGQFALLYTDEFVAVPTDAIGFISIKAKIKLKGLVNISGFHVDPGFKGRLKFSVYNAGIRPIFLEYGSPTFLLWFADMDASTDDPYNGTHNGQQRISTQDREMMAGKYHSPAALDERLTALERHFKLAVAIGGTIIVGVILPILVALIQSWIEKYFGAK